LRHFIAGRIMSSIPLLPPGNLYTPSAASTATTTRVVTVATARPAAAWFNEPGPDGARVLRAPPTVHSSSAQILTVRFMACLCGS
jgi:hypothetical protein